MMEPQEAQKAIEGMLRHYTKPDGSYPTSAKELKETTAWTELAASQAALLNDSGLPVTEQQIEASVLQKLLSDKKKLPELHCHVLHPNAPGLIKEADGWTDTPGLWLIDELGKTHHLPGCELEDDTIAPGTPCTLKNEVTYVVSFGNWGSDSKPGFAYDRPFRTYNMPKGNVEVALNTHEKPFPHAGPGLKPTQKRALKPGKLNTLYTQVGPRDSIEDGSPVMAHVTVDRCFFRDWDSGNYASIQGTTPDDVEVEVLAPIGDLIEQFPGIQNADADNIGDIIQEGNRFLAIGSADFGRHYFLTSMEGEEQANHQAAIMELMGNNFFKKNKKGTGANLDLTKNTKIQVPDADGEEGAVKEIVQPFITVGERRYVNVAVYKKKDDDGNEVDEAKFTMVGEDAGGYKIRAKLKCLPQSGTRKDGTEWESGAGFQMVWLDGTGIRVVDQAEATQISSLFA